MGKNTTELEIENKLQLAEEYLFGDIFTQDPYEAVNVLAELANLGVAKAQKYLGDCYSNGMGVDEKDEDLAFSLYQQAAEQELPEAEYSMSHCYKQGIGVQKDPEEAFLWMKKAAFHGLSIAQLNLAYYYKNGFGTPVDKKKAMTWGQIAFNNPKDPKVEGNSLSEYLKLELMNLKIVDYKTGEDLACGSMDNSYQQKQWVNGEKLHLNIDEAKYKKLLLMMKKADAD